MYVFNTFEIFESIANTIGLIQSSDLLYNLIAFRKKTEWGEGGKKR